MNAAFRTTNYTKECVEKIPTFKKNIIILKYFLGLKGQNNSYTGGLNAYGLCLLYKAYLLNFKLLKETNQIKTLFGFIEFFIKTNWNNWAVFVRGESGLIPKSFM